MSELVTQRLHRGEEDHVADGVGVGEQHHAAVDADAQAARGGQAVLQGVDIVLVHHAGLVVAHLTQGQLVLEAAALVDGIVELGEGVGELGVVDEQLEALGEPGVFGGALRQRGDLHGVHGDEGGLDQVLLHPLVKGLVQGGAPGALAALQIDALGLGGLAGLLVVGDGGKVHAHILPDGVDHSQALPAGGQIDVRTQPLDLVRAQNLLGGGGQDALGDVHHVVEVGIGLIELDGGKLRVVLGIHALVAEDAADLIHPLKAAHSEPLQVQLGGDAHIHVDVQGVVVGDEGPGGGAAGDGVEDGGLHLQVVSLVQELAHMLDEGGADAEGTAHVLVHDQIHIALAVAHLLVGQAVEFLGQRLEGLGEKRHLVGLDRDLAPLGLEDLAFHAHNIADVGLFELGEGLLAQLVHADVELDAALAVLQIAEHGLAHAPLGHDAAGHGGHAALQGLKALFDVGGVVLHHEFGDLEGVLARVLQLLELGAADQALFGQGRLLLGLVDASLFCAHDSAPYF